MNLIRDPETILARFMAGPELLERAISGLQDSDLDAPPLQGGWTIRQIVHHAVDGDDLWKAGIKAALGNEGVEFTLEWYWSLPQPEWAENWTYANRSLDPSIALFRASRDHIVQLMEQVPNAWNRSIGFRKPDGKIEKVTAGFVVEMQADHLEHHVNQIIAMRGDGRVGLPAQQEE